MDSYFAHAVAEQRRRDLMNAADARRMMKSARTKPEYGPIRADAVMRAVEVRHCGHSLFGWLGAATRRLVARFGVMI
jgi:hypothetical protein